ncbi:cellulose synthase operon protein C precursor (plasmid) [Methylobacterium aquaticum]|uniref:Cellulose synthase operon protein C n=1 Tax=Methylobacterium aquaticum TaxID=270351 RepID=A0A0C6FBJ9_9HYPH|nr:cellulose synthase operon protein C precursor [Methylobacterium aquaticum]
MTPRAAIPDPVRPTQHRTASPAQAAAFADVDERDPPAVQPAVPPSTKPHRSSCTCPVGQAGLRAVLAASVALSVMLVPSDGARAQALPAAILSGGAAAPSAPVPPPSGGPPAAAETAPAGAPASEVSKAVAAPADPEPSVPEKALLEQATYWRNQSQPARAIQSLNRILTLNPSAGALSLLAKAQIDAGQTAEARQTLERLRTGYPQDPRVAEIEYDLKVGQPDPAKLEEARGLAQQGRSTLAIQAYQQAFNGATPPTRYASEYYQTLGGTSAGFEPAREGLGQIVAVNPRDPRAQLAYARLLSYQEATRDEAIERLTRLAGNPSIGEEADRALKQALLWLPDTADSQKVVESYAARHPNDAQIAEKLGLIRNPPQSPVEVGGQARTTGFEKLEKKLYTEAEQDFAKALSVNAEDADATAGMGFLRLKQGRFEEGRRLLKQALELGPTDAEGIQSALKSTEPVSGGKGVDEAQLREIRAQYAEVSRLTRRGRYAEAEALLRRLGGTDPDWGYYLQMGAIQALSGKVREAEATYRQALAKKPGNAAATIGLAGVLLRQGREREAEALYVKVGDTRALGRMRAERLRSQARGVADPVAQAGLYRAAVQADPTNPWLRLELARALLRQGRGNDARMVMASVGTDGPDPQGPEAAFYFAVEVKDLDQAAAFAARVPAGKRTPQMLALQQRVAVRAEVAQAAREMNRQAFKTRMLGLAAAPDPTGARVLEIAQTLVGLDDRSAAADAVATALATVPAPSLQQRLAYANALAAADRQDDAVRLVEGIQAADLPRDERKAVSATVNGVTAAAADRLRLDGRYAEALARLSRRLEADPESSALNMALARLYISRMDLGRAVAITQELLARDPADMDVRRAAVSALIAVGDLPRADAVAKEGVQGAPGDARAHMISALVAQALDDRARVMQDLRTARELSRSEGDVRAVAALEDAPAGAAAPVVPQEARWTSGRDAFRPGPLSEGASGRVPDVLGEIGYAQRDSLARRIDRDIADLQDEVAPQVRAGLGFLGRSGEGGLSRLSAITAPIDASFSPGGVGRLRVQVTPTAIDGNTPRGDRLQRFGTNPAQAALGLPNGIAPAQAQEGVGLNLAYSYRSFTVDIGTTPIGFIKTNVVGGIEAAPLLTPELRLRMIAERRAILNSALSYGGARDPVTGATWGGVVRNRGYAQMEWAPGRWFVYAGAGGGVVTGERVRDNPFIEAAIGASYGLYIDGPRELRVGLSVPYFDYAQNQNAFTFGSGGYFSPQNYVALQLPVSWRDQPLPDLGYTLSGSIGYQSFGQRSAAVFPNDRGLQALLSVSDSGIAGIVPGKRGTGLSYAASAEFEYRLSQAFRVGGRAAFQHAGDYSEGSAVVFGRYLFETIQ